MDRIRQLSCLLLQALDGRMSFYYCDPISYTCMVANMNLVSKHVFLRATSAWAAPELQVCLCPSPICMLQAGVASLV